MKKQDLYDFIIETVEARIDEESNKYGTYHKDNLAPIVRKMFAEKLKEHKLNVDSTIKKAYTQLTGIYDLFPDLHQADYSLRRLHSDMSSVTNRVETRLTNELIGLITRNAETGLVTLLEQGFTEKEIVQIGIEVNLYQKIKDEAERKIESLRTLKREANTVVKKSASGKQGYKNLVALGFPMDNFKESINTLPAIQKFSVDTCILKDTCEEEGAKELVN